jgi:hypothetical protein
LKPVLEPWDSPKLRRASCPYEEKKMLVDQPLEPGLGTARIIAAALPSGVVLFWIVSWVVTGGGQEGIAPETLSPQLALWILVGALALGFAAALIFRGRAVGLSQASGRVEARSASQAASAVQTNLVISWALLEAPALLSAVLFLLLAENLLLWMAVPVYALGVVVTFPRAEWFGEGRSPRSR